jgi:hypothetical protein
MYTTVYSVVVDGDTIIEAVVAQYSINKIHQLLFPVAVIVAAVPLQTDEFVTSSVGIGFTVTVPFPSRRTAV